MAQQEGGGVAGVIVDPRFCAPDPVELTIVRKMVKLTNCNFVITDVNGNKLFKVKKRFGLHDRRTLLDGSGSPVLTLRKKIKTLHNWQVFRGENTEQLDLLYTVQRTSITGGPTSSPQSSMLRFKTNLDVFLSHNKEEKICDFRIKGQSDAWIVYAGESDAIVAQMHKDHFLVTVYPNVDYAFIASLVVILENVNPAPPLAIVGALVIPMMI